MPAFHIHPADYPEVHAEGRTSDEACDRLIGLPDRSIDYSVEAWKNGPVGQALAFAVYVAVRPDRQLPRPPRAGLTLSRRKFNHLNILVRPRIVARDGQSADQKLGENPEKVP